LNHPQKQTRRTKMNIGILGTGIVGQSVGAKLMEAGHDVLFGTRDVGKTLARTEPDQYGNPPLSEWKRQEPQVRLGTFQEAAAHGEILFNTTAGAASLAALNQAGAGNLRDKILVDVANPLDASQGFPPLLAVCNTDSLAEQIQNAFPETKVVKTLNTMNCFVMVNPELVPGDHTVFMSGNDGEAKAQVATILTESFGWPPRNIIDLGDISTARGTEMLLPIWIRLYGALQNPMFNFHIAVGAPPQ
jgi:8-hydroxy-5-deazaflavin:NADPH oxidoreductase